MNVRTILLALVGVITALFGVFRIRCRNIHRRDVWLIPVVAPGVHSNDRSGLSDLAHLAIYRNLDQLVYDRSLHICLSAGPVWNYYRDEELKVAIRLRIAALRH